MRDYIERYLWIRDKHANLIKFKINETQDYILKIIETLWRKEIPVRIITLKARQEGVSTLFEAIAFAFTAKMSRIYSQIVSYDDGSARSLYEICQRYYDNLPDEQKPKTKYYTKESLHFSELDSKIIIDSARNVRLARGKTINVLHISEMAMMENIKDLLASARNSVPKYPNTFVGVESTAKGMGNDFHTQWEKASTLKQVLDGVTDELGQTSYVKIFIPWFWDKGYVLKPSKNFKLFKYDHEIYGNEVEYKKTYKLSMEQMAWRRNTIVNECDGSLEVFQQEYPANESEAFLSSGRTRFDKSALAHYWELRKEPEAIGSIKIVESLEEVEEHYGGDAPEVIFTETKGGPLSIWEFPKYEKPHKDAKYGHDYFEYVIGADVAEGIEVDNTSRGKDATDYSVARVWKRRPYELVASYRCKEEPDDFAVSVMALGYYYGGGFIAVENNNHGFIVNKILQSTYPQLYYYMVIDEKKQRKTKKFGWRTDVSTRPYMIDEFAKLLRSQNAVIPDEVGIREYQNFIVYPKGQVKAARSKHDDIVIADCIALQCHIQMPVLDREMKLPFFRKWKIIR